MQIDHIQQQIKNQKEKIQNGISFYWTNYQNSKRKFDVFSVVGSNFLGNVPFVIKGSCWSICNKKEYSDLSFANIWPEKHLILYKDINILDEDLVHFNNDEILNLEGEDINKYFQKLKKEKESKVIIILDKKFFDNIF